MMIRDKQGRPIDIHARPGGWKLSACERDRIYQAFLLAFPGRDWRSSRAWDWMKLHARQTQVSATRIRDFIGQAIQVEQGTLDCNWSWWVGCSAAGQPVHLP